MTCIVGVVSKGTVWLGGDSAATDNALNRTIIKDPKVFVRGKFAFGVCGLPKVMDALAHAIELPEQSLDAKDDRAFLVGTLVPAIRDGLKKLDCTVESPEYGTCFHGSMLMGYNGKLYTLEGNFQLVVPSEDFASVGSGASIALGALHGSKGGNPRKRILAALDASANANAGVAPPFVVVSVKKDG